MRIQRGRESASLCVSAKTGLLDRENWQVTKGTQRISKFN